ITLSGDSVKPQPMGDEPVFGFEVIRVPLYLSWDRSISALPRLIDLMRSFYQAGYIPEGIDLNDGSFSPESGSAGFYAVFARAAQDLGLSEMSAQWWTEAEKKFLDEKDDYYSNILYVLSRLKQTTITRIEQP
ncbi:MAG: hypothetical protein ABR533_07540, partial [Desulfonatronovibrio sp.]